MYQAEKVHGKLHTVRPDEKLTRRLDVGLMVCHFNNNHLVLREFRLSICKRKQQKWHEFWLELLGAREKPITSRFKTASNWHKMHLFSPFYITPSASH